MSSPGKRESWSTRTEPAVTNLFQAPLRSQQPRSLVVLVNVKEIGAVEGMVATGAKITGVSLDSLSEETEIRLATRNYLTVDGNNITNVVGETDLTVTFQGRDVGLNNVAVLETMVLSPCTWD